MSTKARFSDFCFVLLSCFIDRYVRRDELLEARSTSPRETGVMWRYRLILYSRIGASPRSTTGQEDRTEEKKAGGASRMYLSPTSVPSLPL